MLHSLTPKTQNNEEDAVSDDESPNGLLGHILNAIVVRWLLFRTNRYFFLLFFLTNLASILISIEIV